MLRIRIGHQAAAQGNKLKYLADIQHFGSRQRAEFAQTVPRRAGGRDALRDIKPESKINHRNGGLETARFRHEYFIIAFPVYGSQIEAAALFGLFP